jgi:hypothetical protein
LNPWIEFHPLRIKRLQKFGDLRRDLQLSDNEALGLLGSFWGEVMELAEDGDISGWSPAYACERAGSGLNPERVWTALVKHRWIDERADGRRTVHDWLDYAARYLIGKYAGSNKERLVQIWALHGRIYGEKAKSNCTTSNEQPTSKQQPTTPKRLGNGIGKGVLHSRGSAEGEVFEAARQAYGGTKRGFGPEWENFVKKFPDYQPILPLLLPAIERERAHREKLAAIPGAFIPAWAHFQTWINQQRWTQEFGEIYDTNARTGQPSTPGQAQGARVARQAREYPESLEL